MDAIHQSIHSFTAIRIAQKIPKVRRMARILFHHRPTIVASPFTLRSISTTFFAFLLINLHHYSSAQFDTSPPFLNGNGHQQYGAGGFGAPLSATGALGAGGFPYQFSPPLYGGGSSGYGQSPYSAYQPSPFQPPVPQPMFGTGYPIFSPTNSYVCIPYCPPNKYGNGGNPANLSPYGYGIGGGLGGIGAPFGQGPPPLPPSFGGIVGPIGGNGNGGGFQYGGKGFFGQLPGGGLDVNPLASSGALPNSGAYIQTEQPGLNGPGGPLLGGPIGGSAPLIGPPLESAGLFGANGGIFGGHRRSAKNVLGVNNPTATGPIAKVEELKSSSQQKQMRAQKAT